MPTSQKLAPSDDARFEKSEHKHKRQHDQRDHADLLRLALAPQLHDDNRQHFAARAVKQNGRAELAQNDKKHELPTGGESWPGQRQQYARKSSEPSRAMNTRALFQVATHLR